MSSILEKIVEQTREDISRKRRKIAIDDFNGFGEYHRTRRDFAKALVSRNGISVIAELKKASPSKGVIRDSFNPGGIAQSYENNGAAALSVLTDEPFFKGALTYLQEASSIVSIPVLRKDFIIDFYQIEEARAWGADAVLLIVKITDGQQLYELHDAAKEAGLQTLVECYDEDDWERLDFNRFSIVGVNNRNLDTFETDLHRGVHLLRQAPKGVIRVSESGLNQPEDLVMLSENGIPCCLIGEHLMRAEDPGAELARLIAPFSSDGNHS